MALINTPSIARKLQRALRLTRTPDSVLSPDVVPVLLMEDLSQMQVNPGEEERPCLATVEMSAVAGMRGYAAAIKPPDYQNRVVVDSVQITPDFEDVFYVMKTASTWDLYTNETTKHFRDLQLDGKPGTIIGRVANAGLLGDPIWRGWIPSSPNNGLIIPLDIELGDPTSVTLGEFIAVVGETVNQRFFVNWNFRELPPLG